MPRAGFPNPPISGRAEAGRRASAPARWSGHALRCVSRRPNRKNPPSGGVAREDERATSAPRGEPPRLRSRAWAWPPFLRVTERRPRTPTLRAPASAAPCRVGALRCAQFSRQIPGRAVKRVRPRVFCKDRSSFRSPGPSADRGSAVAFANRRGWRRYAQWRPCSYLLAGNRRRPTVAVARGQGDYRPLRVALRAPAYRRAGQPLRACPWVFRSSLTDT